MRYYDKNTKIDFGMYDGYELGIVYVFDPFYINWCIINIEWFHISDLHELRHFGVMNVDEKFLETQRRLGDAGMVDGIDEFNTFQEMLSKVNLGNHLFPFKNEVVNYNFEKLTLENNEIQNDDSGNYENRGSYEEFGGYNGWDDDTINTAFDGDPEATWNVD